MNDELSIKLLIQAIDVNYITCPKCNTPMEPDAKKCKCKWINILTKRK